MSQPGERVGQIRIVGVLGTGGMGKVFEGYDETLQRKVALKTIRRGRRLDGGARARFVREARVLSRLDHPNICRIYDYIEHGESDYLVLELIEGKTLEEVVGDAPSFQTRLEIARQIAGVLVVAHAEGLIHRDLKPGNVMLTPSGQVKVLDFGLARAEVGAASAPAPGGREDAVDASIDVAETLDTDATLDASQPAAPSAPAEVTPFALLTADGLLVGTPLYMSPEQARGEPLTTASDLFSFGLLLQHLFTGKDAHPLKIGRGELIQRARRGETLPVQGLDGDLSSLIERLKAMAPAARPTAVATLERLEWIRDKPRRRLRRLAAAAVTALIVLAGVKYTLDLRHERALAVEARELAEQRRGQAEDLIGFMLGDLRKKLEPLGQLDILDDVGDKAMDYYAVVDESELSDEELLSRSRALYQIGEVRIAQGNLEAALEPLNESLALAGSLVGRDPDSGDRLFEAGQGHFWVGFVHWRRGDLDAALEQFEAYLEISEKLVAMDPANLDWQLELLYANSNIGSILQAKGELEDALDRFQGALAVNRKLVVAAPDNTDWQLELARSYNTVAFILEAMGDFAGALDTYRAELAIKESLEEQQPEHAQWRYELAINLKQIGDLQLAMGSVDGSLANYRRASSQLEALTARDPTNTPWARQLAVTLAVQGGALDRGGDPDAARRKLRAAIGILERLVAQDATDAGWQRDLAESWVLLGDTLAGSGLLSVAEAAGREAQRILEALVEDHPEDRMALASLSRAHTLLGRVWSLRGDATRAASAWRRAVECVQPVAAGATDHRLLDPLARALLHLGRMEEARPLIERLEAYGFRDPALRALARAA